MDEELQIVEHVFLVHPEIRGNQAVYARAVRVVVLLGPEVVFVDEFFRFNQVFSLDKVWIRVRESNTILLSVEKQIAGRLGQHLYLE